MPSFEKKVSQHGREQNDDTVEVQAKGQEEGQTPQDNETLDSLRDPLNEAIAHYTDTLMAFKQDTPAPSQHDAIAVLMARDRILTLLSMYELSPALSIQLVQLDGQLRSSSTTISKILPLTDYIVALGPPKKAWWWYFDAPEEVHPWDRLDWLWSSLSIACFTAAISLIADVSSRFLSGGPDTLGAFTISTQSILTLVTARSALTTTGQQAVRRLLERIRLPRYLWQEAGFVLAALLLLGMLGFYSSLPAIAGWYQAWGDEAACIEDGFSTLDCSRNPLVAEQLYKRALELDPQNLTVHFHLGQLYEQLNELDKAHDQYQIAALTGANPDTAENSTWATIRLSRLHILEGDYATAISLLQQSIALNNRDIAPSTNAHLYKTFGWARYEQGRLLDAEAQLNLAITFEEKAEQPLPIGHTHCLLAQTLEDLGKIDEVALHWQLCLGFSKAATNPEEEEWVDIARQKALDQWNPNSITEN